MQVLSKIFDIVEKICKCLFYYGVMRERKMVEIGGFFYRKLGKFCKVEVAKLRNFKKITFFRRKKAVFPKNIWWNEKKAVPLHAFSRRVYAYGCEKVDENRN